MSDDRYLVLAWTLLAIAACLWLIARHSRHIAFELAMIHSLLAEEHIARRPSTDYTDHVARPASHTEASKEARHEGTPGETR